jgi:hypothetical protein
MVKRELLILAGFGLAGVVAYLATTAPPSPARTTPSTLSSLITSWRERASRLASSATVQTAGTIVVAPLVRELRLSSVNRVRVVGETRADIAWTLVIDAEGPSPAAARAAAATIALKVDDLGQVLALSTGAPQTVRHTSDVTLHVPSHLALHVEHARQCTVEGLAGVRLENLVGDVAIRSVDGEVAGTLRNGLLRITDAGSIRLTLVGVKSVLTGTRGQTTVTSRSGESRVDRAQGTVVLDVNNDAVTIVDSLAPVRISATGGWVDIERPRQSVQVDARRTRIAATLDAAAPATLQTSDASLTLRLGDVVPVTIDAVATDGTISATGLRVTPESRDRETRVHHVLGSDARVSLRNTRGPIVIASGK